MPEGVVVFSSTNCVRGVFKKHESVSLENEN